MNTDTLRQSDLSTAVEILRSQQARKHDVLVSPGALRTTAADGQFGMLVPDPTALTLDGIGADRFSRMSAQAVGQMATRTGIPRDYMRLLAETPAHAELAATNANYWLERDPRPVFVRSFQGDDGGTGLVRAMLSERYGTIDHLDAVMATLAGFHEAGIHPAIQQCDLTENRLFVRFVSPEISTNIADLVKNYQHKGRGGQDLPLLHAGLVLQNSETGAGSYTLVPRVEVQVCTNGMTRPQEAYSRRHIGEKLETGIIRASDDTIQKTLALVSAQTRDMVKAVMSVEYLERVANELREFHGVAVTRPTVVVEVIAKTLKWTESQQDDLLNAFIGGGDFTVLGIGQAITAMAQDAPDGEKQADGEDSVWNVMAIAAKACATA